MATTFKLDLVLLPFEVVLEATAFSLMSLRADEPLVVTMVSTFFFFSAAELAWDWVSMAMVHSSAPHGGGITCQRSRIFRSRWSLTENNLAEEQLRLPLLHRIHPVTDDLSPKTHIWVASFSTH